MKFQDLKKNLANGISKIYFIKGEDAFLRQKAVDMIESKAVNFKDINILRFDDENTNLGNIIDSARALPMLDERRVVVLKDIAVKKQDDIKPLIDYAKKPTPTTVLIVVDSVGVSAYKKFEELSDVVDCGKLDSNMLSRLILNQLGAFNCKINSDALNALIGYCDLDYTRINNETIKLANLIGNGGTITLRDVEENVHREVEYDIFELSNAVAVCDCKKAIDIIKQLLERKESPQMLIMMIQGSFRRMFYASLSKETNAQIATKLGVKEYSIRISREQAQKFTPVRLKKILDLGANLDYQIKAGQMSDENALIYYITNICEQQN